MSAALLSKEPYIPTQMPVQHATAQSKGNDTHHRGWFRIDFNQKRPTCSSKEPYIPTQMLVEHATAQSKGNDTHHRGCVHICIQKRPTCPSTEPTIPTQMLVEHATAQSQSNDTHHRRCVHIYIHQKRPTFLSKEPYIFVAEGWFRVISIKKIKEIPHITEGECAYISILQNTLHFHPKPPILLRKEPSITPATAHIKVIPRITAGEFVYISVKRALYSCQKSPIFLSKYL